MELSSLLYVVMRALLLLVSFIQKLLVLLIQDRRRYCRWSPVHLLWYPSGRGSSINQLVYYKFQIHHQNVRNMSWRIVPSSSTRKLGVMLPAAIEWSIGVAITVVALLTWASHGILLCIVAISVHLWKGHHHGLNRLARQDITFLIAAVITPFSGFSCSTKPS